MMRNDAAFAPFTSEGPSQPSLSAQFLRIHTQPRFINHDGVAEGLLNHGHCTAVGFLVPWKVYLTNSDALLNLMMTRMEVDWVALAPKMRKPWNLKDLESRKANSLKINL